MTSRKIQTEIGDLPPEVLEMIMTYLNPSDRRDASCVNKRFLEAASNTSKIVIRFERCHLDDNCEPLKTFLESPRKFTRIFIDKVTFGDSLDQFGQHFGPTVTELKIDLAHESHIDRNLIESLLKHMTVLTTLKVHHKTEEFMLWFGANTLETVTNFRLTVGNITHKQFFRVLDLLPNLEVLECNFNLLTDYCDDNPETYDEVVLSVIQRYPRLKEFTLYNSYSGGIPRIEKNLREFVFTCVLRLSFPLRSTKEECAKYLEANKTLIHLGQNNESEIPAIVNGNALEVIGHVLPGLETFNVEAYDLPDSHDLDFLIFLSNLRFFAFDARGSYERFYFSPKDHKLHDLPVNLRMKHFALPRFSDPCQLCLDRLFTSFPNLQCLNLARSDLTDDNLHVIFKNLPLLRVLDISECEEITNAGICGLIGGILKPVHSLSNLKGLRVLDISGCRQITEDSIMKSFHLPALVEFKTNRMKLNEAARTIFTLTQKCAAIEKFVVNFGGFNHDCVRIIAKNLQRLKSINFPYGYQLSRQARDDLEKHCKHLKYKRGMQSTWAESLIKLFFK